MTQTLDKIINKIKEKNIQPKPKWIFIVKNFVFWVLVPILMIFGGLSFSIVVYMISNNDWDLQSRVSNNFFEFILKTAPYFWIIVLIIFLIFFYFDFKKTKNGYKLEFLKIILFGFSIIIFSGILFYSFGVGKYLDKSFLKVQTYKTLSCQNAKMWNNPENGILAGKFAIVEKKVNTFKDLNEKTWNVSFENEDDLIGLDLNNNMKLIGRKIDENNFYAESIREMRCGCQMKDCNCRNSERNFIDKRSNSCGAKLQN